MALFGPRIDDDWHDADISTSYPEDLFKCVSCDIEFGLESDKIQDKKIVCPVCQKTLKAWRIRV